MQEILTSKANPVIKTVKSLSQKKYRDSLNLFTVEGTRFVEDSIQYGAKVKYILRTGQHRSYFDDERDIVVSDALFMYISTTKTPQGVIGVFEKPHYEIGDILNDRRILFLEGVQNSENTGSLIRSAVCAGYDSVLANRDTADCYSPRAVRASAASVLGIRTYCVETDFLSTLKREGFYIIGTHLSGTEEPLSCLERKTVLIMGNEGSGMSDASVKICDRLVRIPIYGRCESLNVMAAGTLLMYRSIGY